MYCKVIQYLFVVEYCRGKLVEDSILAYVKVYQPCSLEDVINYYRNTIGQFKVRDTVFKLIEEGKLKFNDNWLLEMKNE